MYKYATYTYTQYVHYILTLICGSNVCKYTYVHQINTKDILTPIFIPTPVYLRVCVGV
jgi:hypothetical protein